MHTTPLEAWVNAAEAKAPITLVATDTRHFAGLIDSLGADARSLCQANDFSGQDGRFLAVPSPAGPIMLAGCQAAPGLYALASLPQRLPPGDYQLDARGLALDPAAAALGWALGAYRYARYRRSPRASARLVIDQATLAGTRSLASASYRVRDLVNTPTQDLGPADLAADLEALAKQHGAQYRQWVGKELLADNFPTIHAVGRAATAERAPRLCQLSHGAADAPHVILVGKGVCFDSGGLDIKSADGMRWMKKDMGGAAHAIGLAQLILDAGLPIRLTVLIAAVENAISADAFRPGEVIRTRGGHTVEIDNTDAEGRLVLADALALAAEQKPDLILDFATLTGAARVALGPELPALFCNRDEIAEQLLACAKATTDPLWRMPLWRPYLAMLNSHVADLANSGTSRHAGAISAALFLERFVPEATAWCHLDVYSWNDADRPGHPRGGEAQGLRAYIEFLRRRYAA